MRQTVSHPPPVDTLVFLDLGDAQSATVRVLRREWTAHTEIVRLEDHTGAGFGWWAWAHGKLCDAGGASLVETRVGPVGMPSKGGAIRDAQVEARARLRDCAWGMAEGDA